MQNYLAAKQERKSCPALCVKITASSWAGILLSITQTCSPEHVCGGATHALPPAFELRVGAEGAASGLGKSGRLPRSAPIRRRPIRDSQQIIIMEYGGFEIAHKYSGPDRIMSESAGYLIQWAGRRPSVSDARPVHLFVLRRQHMRVYIPGTRF